MVNSCILIELHLRGNNQNIINGKSSIDPQCTTSIGIVVLDKDNFISLINSIKNSVMVSRLQLHDSFLS